MSVTISVNQEQTYDSGEDNDNDENGTAKKKHKYYHWDSEWASQNIQQDSLCTNPIFNDVGFC